MTKILITGGSGLVGQDLTSLLLKKGYQVGILSRKKINIENVQTFLWDNNSIQLEALQFADIIIHLAGANVGSKRWNKKQKQIIIDSRVGSGELIRKELIRNKITIKAFISASAIGFYGEGGNLPLTETSSVITPDFLSNVCVKWENMATKFSGICRSASVRVGFVLDKNSPGFNKLVLPINMGVGAPLGKGNQYMSWVHIQDLSHIFLKVIEDNTLHGVINACSPTPLTNRELTKSIAKHLKKPLFMPPVPKFILRLLLGEMGDLALVGSRIIPEKLLNHGYQFQFPTIESALEEIYP